ncbi:MAG: hypothetical protein JWR09_2758 [Mucilaginibacter sp.]|nr:hypothetical protein [Mucilaginibacter sp.]
MTHKVFISYSAYDRQFVSWLVDELKSANVDVWWDQQEVTTGDYIKDKIKEGIQASSAFIIILSKNSAKSTWVKYELNSALMFKAAENNVRIIPIKIDDFPVPPDLMNYIYVDASIDRQKAISSIIRTLSISDEQTYKFKDWTDFTARRFEELVHDLLLEDGHTVKRMPPTRDESFDLEIQETNSFNQLERTLVEVKFFQSRKLSISNLTVLYGALLISNATRGLLVTNSELTNEAKEFLIKTAPKLTVWEGLSVRSKLIERPVLIRKYFPGSVPRKESVNLVDDELQMTQSLIKELDNCPEGMPGWKDYENICIEIFNYLFVPPLNEPKIQYKRESGIDIRDAIYPNRGLDDNWRFIREDYDAKYIVVEFKNYAENGSDIDKHVVLQIDDYLKKQTIGHSGIICSKKSPNSSGLEKRRDIFIENNKLVLFLNNEHLKDMLLRKYKKLDLFDVINDLIDDFNLKF